MPTLQRRGCGCGKRAQKILDASAKYEIRLPDTVMRFLEKKAATEKNADGGEEQ